MDLKRIEELENCVACYQSGGQDDEDDFEDVQTDAKETVLDAAPELLACAKKWMAYGPDWDIELDRRQDRIAALAKEVAEYREGMETAARQVVEGQVRINRLEALVREATKMDDHYPARMKISNCPLCNYDYESWRSRAKAELEGKDEA